MQPAIPIRKSLLQPAPLAPVAAPSVAKVNDKWGFLEIFILSQVVLPCLLYLPGTQALRVPIRIAPFAFGLLGFFFLLTSGKRVRAHPSASLLILITVYLAAMIAAPGTNTLAAGAAQVMIYFAVMAPVFWAPSLVRSKRQLNRIMAILLICNGLNAVVGVLQVKYPDTFMPKELSSIVMEAGGPGSYVGPNGEVIIRPTGLSDNPGAVCGPAAFAALLGIVVAIRPGSFWYRVAAAGMAFSGVAAIFLSHVRTSFLIAVGMCVVYLILLLLQKQQKRAVTFAATSFGLITLGLMLAAVLGGEAVTDRFLTLLDEDPTTVYQRNRGNMMMIDTQRYLSEYPMGAGLARWGMMRVYFGDESNYKSPPLWAEIQWPAWVLDGGIVVMLLYAMALIRDLFWEYRASRLLQNTSMASDVAVIFAANCGVIALLFSFTPFTSQIGVQYWFLAGVLHGAMQLPRGELT